MSKKKILWIILLILAVVILVIALILARPNEKIGTQTQNNSIFNKSETSESQNNSNDKQYQKQELDDGILYSLDGKKVESDIVIGDNYFDTTINDIYLNPDNYTNKNIEVEGMFLDGMPYTFVGRYSNSNICQYCPVGYSYIEYQLDGSIDRELENEKDWIKVIGTLQKGNDETSDYEDYFYLKVINLEIMNESGQKTVEN